MMFFKKQKKDFLERFPEIIWWEIGDKYSDIRYVGGKRIFQSFSSDGFVYYTDKYGLSKERFHKCLKNHSLAERRLEASCNFAKEDYQIILDKVREGMQQLKGEE